jgi:hypothetical protein
MAARVPSRSSGRTFKRSDLGIESDIRNMRASSEVITHNLEIERRHGILLQSKLSELKKQVAQKKTSMRDAYIQAETNKKHNLRLKTLKMNLNQVKAKLGSVVG